MSQGCKQSPRRKYLPLAPSVRGGAQVVDDLLTRVAGLRFDNTAGRRVTIKVVTRCGLFTCSH